MKWNKFIKKREQYPWIGFYLRPYSIRTESDSKLLREAVRTNLRYIAERPIEELTFEEQDSLKHGQIPVESHYSWLVPENWDKVSYYVLAHIEGESFGSRIKSLYDSDDKALTIFEAIDNYYEWHRECWVLQGKDIIFDAIVRVSDSGNNIRGLIGYSIEIFLFRGKSPKEIIEAKKIA